eukprot:8372355-Alexandrium_andersonii.AAC.1
MQDGTGPATGKSKQTCKRCGWTTRQDEAYRGLCIPALIDAGLHPRRKDVPTQQERLARWRKLTGRKK